MTLRILTLNIWNRQGPWAKRLRLIRRELHALEPDIVGLQEVMRNDVDGLDQAAEIADGLGYACAYGVAARSGGGEYGNAVLSKFPILAVDTRPLPSPSTEEGRSILHVDVSAPWGRTPFFVTHLHWKAEHGALRVEQAAAVVDAVNALAPPGAGGFPAVLAGDFNADPETDEIQLICAGQGARGAMRPFVDCFVAASGALPGHTFARSNRYAKGCERNQRIDYVFVREVAPGESGVPLAARVVCTVPHGGVFPSDHYGVFVELSVARPAAGEDNRQAGQAS